MKTISNYICIAVSCMFLMCNASIKTTAQTMAGKWHFEGSEMVVHFSKEGALKLTVAGSEDRFGIYYIEDGMLGIIYVDESDEMKVYEINSHTKNALVFTDGEGYTCKLFYKGNHEIHNNYIQTVVKHYGDELGGETGLLAREMDSISTKDEEYTSSSAEDLTNKSTLNDEPDLMVPFVGIWEWRGDNGTGIYEVFPNGIWKVTYNGQYGERKVVYYNYKINGNRLTQKFMDGSRNEYEIQIQDRKRGKLTLTETNRSWTFTYAGKAVPSSEDKKVFSSQNVGERLENPGKLLKNLHPDNLSLVGCWEHSSGIGDPFVFDENGFFRVGNFNGDYNYGYQGLYNFDGQTLTFHVHSGGGLNYTVGETYTYEINDFSSQSMKIVMGKDYNGEYYRPQYNKTNRYRLKAEHLSEVQGSINIKQLENTKWVSGNTEYIFLEPNFMIMRKNGKSYNRQWHFNGNTLWVKEISSRDDDYTSLGEVVSWTNQILVADASNGRKTLKAGYHVASLNTNEQTLYINYLKIHHAVFFQAMIGTGQGMGIYDVEWKN